MREEEKLGTATDCLYIDFSTSLRNKDETVSVEVLLKYISVKKSFLLFHVIISSINKF